jgi:hypothetical protein
MRDNNPNPNNNNTNLANTDLFGMFSAPPPANLRWSLPSIFEYPARVVPDPFVRAPVVAAPVAQQSTIIAVTATSPDNTAGADDVSPLLYSLNTPIATLPGINPPVIGNNQPVIHPAPIAVANPASVTPESNQSPSPRR